MKVLFLDIDGVLNHECWYRDRFNKEIYPEGVPTYPLSEFYPESVKRLNKILKETGAKIVLSTSWRFDKDIDTILSVVGINQTIYDKTPYCGHKYGSLCRGKEIKEYLNNHTEITNYAIVDDDSDMEPEQMNNFYQTSEYDGLNDKATDILIGILNGENKKN